MSVLTLQTMQPTIARTVVAVLSMSSSNAACCREHDRSGA
ncbi:class III lanthipeptide [Streptomyces sp. NBC_01477]|nr:class III lanthipeptide [Streptomyces sp. NBC_01477]